MSLKPFFNLIGSKLFWKNIALAIGIFLVLCIIILFWLRIYTHHNQNVEVPQLSGLYVEEAELQLDKFGLSYEVVDSVYIKKKKPGEILEQKPEAGSLVKEGRKIYITINSKSPRQISIPDVINVSYRQAKFTLENLGFVVSDIEYKPSEYADLVMDVKYNGQTAKPGTKLKDGSSIVLVVGESDSDETAVVPDVSGLSYDEAVSSINDNDFVVGNVLFDEDPANDDDKNNYYVYHQTPIPSDIVTAGKRINIWLSKDKGKKFKDTDKGNDEVFF